MEILPLGKIPVQFESSQDRHYNETSNSFLFGTHTMYLLKHFSATPWQIKPVESCVQMFDRNCSAKQIFYIYYGPLFNLIFCIRYCHSFI